MQLPGKAPTSSRHICIEEIAYHYFCEPHVQGFLYYTWISLPNVCLYEDGSITYYTTIEQY